MKLIKMLPLLLASLCLSAQEAETAISTDMSALAPVVSEHVTAALKEIASTDDGAFLKKHVAPRIRFEAKPMPQLGFANPDNVITLESLRLENGMARIDSDQQNRIKLCFTAEILSHELLHNAQFRAGLSAYPSSFSGLDSVLCEKLLELQAKYFGEKMFNEIRRKPEFRRFVKEKSGLYLVMLLQSKNPEKDYLETIWLNRKQGAGGTKIFYEQIREMAFWNLSYAEQAFRNNYGRFLADDTGREGGGEVFFVHAEKIIQFTKMPLDPRWLRENAPVKAIPHGIACYEDGRKVLELIAFDGGYRKRSFSGQIVRETTVSIRKR